MMWGNPLDKILKKLKKNKGKKILVCWNRGLGDIPLGLVALVHRIRTYIPDAHIWFLTREDLASGFAFVPSVEILVASTWKRGVKFDLEKTLESLGMHSCNFDCILEKPDPTRWLGWQLGTFTPRLEWKDSFERPTAHLGLSPGTRYVGVHVHSETVYNYEKNWPIEKWRTVFERLSQDREVLLFGMHKQPSLSMSGIRDLRGETTFFELMSIVKNHCDTLIVPDSGLLAFTYYLDVSFPVKIVSLWADPRQGVLRQNVPSPNPQLMHIPLLGKGEDISAISEEAVLCAVL